MNNIFPELPAKLGIYTLTELLAEREHSERYLATQSYVDRAVIIEVLRPNCAAEIVEKFQNTVRKRAAVSLPHVSPTLESGKMGILHYLILEQPVGVSLAERLTKPDPSLSLEEAFSFLQAVADMYKTCHERGVAADPLSLDSIYVKGDSFSFLSPVVDGQPTDEQRLAQMTGLADIVEKILPPDIVSRSNISIIIHWLRNGYGNVALEWGQLASSFATLRAQKFSLQKDSLSQWNKMAVSRLRRMLRRAVRSLKHHPVFACILLLLIVAPVVVTTLLRLAVDEPSARAAVTDEFVYCGNKARSYRVMTRPVSIAEFEDFLQAYAGMSPTQKKELVAEGTPKNASFEPLDWKNQLMAAKLNVAWNSRQLDRNSPVCGVTYWAAAAYARYKQGELPTAEQLKVVRSQVQSPEIEEWTSSKVPAELPYEESVVVLPGQGEAELLSADLGQQNPLRGFRVSFDQSIRTK